MRVNAPGFRWLRHGDTAAWLAEGLPEDWARSVLESAASSAGDRRRSVDAPDGGRARVKIYRRRPSHGFWRRLGSGRALREGLGYVAFRDAGIPTVPTLLFGECRRRRLLDHGLVVTREIDAVNVEKALADGGDLEVVADVAGVLAEIHRAGLVHGDPLLRNFLAASPAPVPIDLSNWGRATRARHAEDLVRFLGSCRRGPGGEEAARRGLGRYREQASSLPLPEEEVIRRVREYAEAKDRKEARAARQRSEAGPSS